MQLNCTSGRDQALKITKMCGSHGQLVRIMQATMRLRSQKKCHAELEQRVSAGTCLHGGLHLLCHSFAVHPSTLTEIPFQVACLTFAMLLAMSPVTFEPATIRPNEKAVTVLLIHCILPIINLSARTCQCPPPMQLPVLPLSPILASIGKGMWLAQVSCVIITSFGEQFRTCTIKCSMTVVHAFHTCFLLRYCIRGRFSPIEFFFLQMLHSDKFQSQSRPLAFQIHSL